MAVEARADELGLNRHSEDPQLLSLSLRDSDGLRPLLKSRELWCSADLDREEASSGDDEREKDELAW